MNWGVTCFFERREDFKMVAELAPVYPLRFLEIRGERPFFAPEDLTETDIQFFNRIIRQSGLTPSLHATFYDINLATINTILKQSTLECYKVYLELAARLSVRVMVVHGGLLHQDAARIDRLRDIARNHLVDNLKILGDIAAGKNVTIALENSPPNRNRLMVPDHIQHLEILQAVDHPNIRACFDTAHASLHGLDLTQYYRHIQPYLVEIHSHNNDGKDDLHLAIDQGVIDYESFFRENKPEVPVILEIRNLPEAIQSLEWIKNFEE